MYYYLLLSTITYCFLLVSFSDGPHTCKNILPPDLRKERSTRNRWEGDNQIKMGEKGWRLMWKLLQIRFFPVFLRKLLISELKRSHPRNLSRTLDSSRLNPIDNPAGRVKGNNWTSGTTEMLIWPRSTRRHRVCPATVYRHFVHLCCRETKEPREALIRCVWLKFVRLCLSSLIAVSRHIEY